MKYGKQLKVIEISLLFFIILTLTVCGDGGDDDPKEHTGTVRVLDKDISVKGVSSISVTDFNTAIGKLEEAITFLEEEEKNNLLMNNTRINITRLIYPIATRHGTELDIGYTALVDDIVYVMANFSIVHRDTVRVLDKDIPVGGIDISEDDFYIVIDKFEEAFSSLDENQKIDISDKITVISIRWGVGTLSWVAASQGKKSIMIGYKASVTAIANWLATL